MEDSRKKRKSREKSIKRLVNKFEMQGFMSQKGLWNLAKENILKERRELPQEQSDAAREYKATHEENFNWVKEA